MYSIISLLVLGIIIGLLLGISSYFLKVKQEPIIEEILNILPKSNCGSCGHIGCEMAARALSKGVNITCAPGGKDVIDKLKKLLNIELKENEQVIAEINHNLCIGCNLCFNKCSTDAIVGAPKQLHIVLENQCFGCKICEKNCPTMAIKMVKPKITIENWHWPKPK